MQIIIVDHRRGTSRRFDLRRVRVRALAVLGGAGAFLTMALAAFTTKIKPRPQPKRRPGGLPHAPQKFLDHQLTVEMEVTPVHPQTLGPTSYSATQPLGEHSLPEISDPAQPSLFP